MSDKAFESENDENLSAQYLPVKEADIKVGASVFVKNINQTGVVQNVRLQKKEAEVLCGNIRVRSKFSDLFVVIAPQTAQNTKKPTKFAQTKKQENVQITKRLNPKPMPSLEINVIGLTVHEAIPEVEAFIDAAVIANLEEVRIVHGVGTGKLRAGIHEFLRSHRNVEQYRLGKYGEGETGVTVVKIK